jgi:hypothetical protein
MRTHTVTQLIDLHGVDVDAHLDREATVPVSTGLQRQGDVIVVPARMVRPGSQARTAVPRAGVAVVRGEAGGNTHLLLADGPVRFDAAPRDLTLGVLTVDEGATAYLAHPEHGYAGIGPGTYVVRRQREQADEIRMVAD